MILVVPPETLGEEMPQKKLSTKDLIADVEVWFQPL